MFDQDHLVGSPLKLNPSSIKGNPYSKTLSRFDRRLDSLFFNKIFPAREYSTASVLLQYISQLKMLFVTTGSQRKMLQSHSHPQTFTHTHTHSDNIFLFPLSSHLQIHSRTLAKMSNGDSFELAAQLAEFWLGRIGESGVETLERLPYPHNLAGRQLEPVPQQAREEVQRLGSRRGEPVDAVPHLQKHEEGRVLGALRVRVVQLQDQVLDPLWVKVHAVAKHLQAVDFHVAKIGRLVVQVQRFVKKGLVDDGVVGDDATAQVNVHSLKEGLPPAAEIEGPVIALERGVQFSSFPVWKVLLVDGHEPALRVTAPEGVDVDCRHGFQRAVLGGTDLERDPHQHMDEVGLVLVALQGEQHALPPRRVEPAAQADVIADVDGVDLHAAV